MDKSVKYSETLSAKFHAEYQEKDKSYKQLKDELETLKYSVDRTAADLESMRGQNHHLFREVKDQNSRLDTLHHQRLIMAEEHKKSVQKTLSSEERAHKMDEILAEEESQVKKLEKEISLQREKQFKLTQKLNEEKRKKENVEAEIQSSKVALRNLVSKQRMVDEECLKQQEIIYMQDLQLQQLEHKLSRLDGERTEDEKALLTEKIKELENEWCSQHQTETLLQNQLKRLQDDLRRTMRDVEKSHGEKNILIGKIDELNLHIDSTKRESKKINHNKEDLIVDKNIIMLELQRLRDILFSYSNEIVSLEKGKLQLNTVSLLNVLYTLC
jgi:UDP-glucose:O-linked fucose beta-1,3-glucosyltransferase